MAVSQSPTLSSIDLSGLPVEVAEAVAQVVDSSFSINGQEKFRHDVMNERQRPRRDRRLEDRREQLCFRPRHPVLQGQRGSVRQAHDKPDRT